MDVKINLFLKAYAKREILAFRNIFTKQNPLISATFFPKKETFFNLKFNLKLKCEKLNKIRIFSLYW